MHLFLFGHVGRTCRFWSVEFTPYNFALAGFSAFFDSNFLICLVDLLSYLLATQTFMTDFL
jgi:hypothetical protein